MPTTTLLIGFLPPRCLGMHKSARHQTSINIHNSTSQRVLHPRKYNLTTASIAIFTISRHHSHPSTLAIPDYGFSNSEAMPPGTRTVATQASRAYQQPPNTSKNPISQAEPHAQQYQCTPLHPSFYSSSVAAVLAQPPASTRNHVNIGVSGQQQMPVSRPDPFSTTGSTSTRTSVGRYPEPGYNPPATSFARPPAPTFAYPPVPISDTAKQGLPRQYGVPVSRPAPFSATYSAPSLAPPGVHPQQGYNPSVGRFSGPSPAAKRGVTEQYGAATYPAWFSAPFSAASQTDFASQQTSVFTRHPVPASNNIKQGFSMLPQMQASYPARFLAPFPVPPDTSHARHPKPERSPPPSMSYIEKSLPLYQPVPVRARTSSSCSIVSSLEEAVGVAFDEPSEASVGDNVGSGVEDSDISSSVLLDACLKAFAEASEEWAVVVKEVQEEIGQSGSGVEAGSSASGLSKACSVCSPTTANETEHLPQAEPDVRHDDESSRAKPVGSPLAQPPSAITPIPSLSRISSQLPRDSRPVVSQPPFINSSRSTSLQAPLPTPAKITPTTTYVRKLSCWFDSLEMDPNEAKRCLLCPGIVYLLFPLTLMAIVVYVFLFNLLSLQNGARCPLHMYPYNLFPSCFASMGYISRLTDRSLRGVR
ncbi:hypothetical protein BDQ17DRAFT_690522 [Cyathus striatus]|nr:hypothetical protein BDQ17DRAFT_690522 [Cyathus striatus]